MIRHKFFRLRNKFLWVWLLAAPLLDAQHHHAMDGDAEAPADHGASGTSANPASSPAEMIHLRAGSWHFALHGVAFLVEEQQSGPRGGDKFFSANWFMGVAQHRARRGTVQFRSMLSLDPATVTDRRYPLLFQTGETAFGKPIVDGQHPHDFFMELSFQYARPLGEKTAWHLYLAPVGDPALGPVAYPHRISAAELPQATLSHHLQDSQHIVNEVVTTGITHGMFRLEASGFHGAEPNERRWNIDHGAIDSWAGRLTLTPARNWSGQVSVGRLTRPEQLERDDIVRSTASITYNTPLAAGNWASSFIWGRNHKTVAQRNLNSFLVESVLQFRHKNYVTGRFELVDKDELFDDRPALKERLERTIGSNFRIAAYTLGYTRDVKLFPGVETGFGGNVTLHTVPSAIEPFYGRRPLAAMVYMRLRLKGSGSMQGGHASHRS